jgi:hypothetical protein
VAWAVVAVGPAVHLVFVEAGEDGEALIDADERAMDGVHICVYIEAFRRRRARRARHGSRHPPRRLRAPGGRSTPSPRGSSRGRTRASGTSTRATPGTRRAHRVRRAQPDAASHMCHALTRTFCQFRFKDIVDGDGVRLLELEHETRARRHFQYFKRVAYTPR